MGNFTCSRCGHTRSDALPVCPRCGTSGDQVGLDAAVAAFIPWAEKTFPEATADSCVAHLASEVRELLEAPDDPEELADAAMLVFHAAHLAGVDLAAAVRAKLEKNRAREWGPVNEAGFREHVREEEAPHV